MKKYVIIGLIFIHVLLSVSSIYSSDVLRVITTSPNGPLYSLHQAEQITVTFDKPVTSLGNQVIDRPEWFEIHPTVQGTFEWLGTSTLVFRPTDELHNSTEYSVKIKSGLEGIDGSELKQDFRFSFRTPVPVVQYSYPSMNERSIDVKTDVKLYFNIPVSPVDIRTHLRFNAYDNEKYAGKAVAYDIVNQSDEPSYEIIIMPERDLEVDQRYIVTVTAGFSAPGGTLGSETDWSLKFQTYTVFQFSGIKVQDDESTVNPGKSIALEFSNPVEYSKIMKHITLTPSLPLDDYGESYQNNRIYIYGPFSPETEYTVLISRELTDIFANKLDRDYKATFRTRSFDPTYKIPLGESIIEAYGDASIPIELVNLSELDIKVRDIPRDSLDVIAAWFNRKSTISEKDVLGTNYDRRIHFTGDVKKNKLTVLPLNADDYRGERKYGNFIVQFHGKEQREHGYRYKLLLVQVTELGLTAKFSPVTNGIFVTELRTGRPLPRVRIEVRDGTGKVYWRGVTDSTGYCESPGWQRLGMPASKNDEPVQWIAATRGDDVAYTHSQKGTGISPWEFNISYEWMARDEQIDGALFTDRGIYRPDDTVHVKVVLREKDGFDWKLTRGDSFKVTINDPAGETIYERLHSANEFSAFNFSVPLAHDAKRGYYSIQVIVPQKLNWERWISSSFWVEDYRPAEFEVTVEPQRGDYVFGDSVKASINGNYLFGAAMKDATLKWAIIKSTYYHTPTGWDGYYFHPRDYSKGKFSGIGSFGDQVVTGEDMLDSNGHASIVYYADEPNLLTSASFMIEGTVIDQNRREITGSREVIVHRGEYQVGIRPGSFFGNSGKLFGVDVITTTHEGSIVPDKRVEIKLVRRNWYSVRKAGTGGRYFWETEIADSLISSETVETRTKPIRYEFTPQLAGYYLLRAVSTDGRGNRIVSDCSFYILGKDYVAWERSDDDRIELEKDKQVYAPGETATILIKSPFERATALVTMEREGIMDYYFTEVVGSTPSISISIDERYIPNIYVSVMLIQGRTGDGKYNDEGEDIAKPAFKLGYINLVVNSGHRKLTVDIATDKQNYKPGEYISIRLSSKDWRGVGKKSEVILAVVDKGVLNLTDYHFTDLHDYFFRSRPLGVTSSDSRLDIIGQRNYGEKGENRGGGGGRNGFSSMFIRKDFKTTPYWNPGIITNDDGTAEVRFKLPDNMTTFVIMAAVHDLDSNFGNNEKSFRVSQPLVLQPSLPRFLRYADTIESGTLIHNYSESGSEASVSVKTEGIEFIGDENTKRIFLNAGESKEVRFRFKAHRTGDASFLFQAVMGEHQDAVIKTIPVIRPLTYEVVATANNTTEKAEEKISVPGNIYELMSSLEVKTSSTQLVGISDGIRYLYEYPYGCLEQRVSRILPMILFDDVIESFDLPALKDKNYREEVEQFLKTVSDYMTPGGGFAYWKGGDMANPFVTAWTVLALVEAKEKGYRTVSDDVIARTVNFLKEVLRSKIDKDLYPYSWNYWASTNSLIMYDLALLGEPDHAYIEKMYADRNRIPYFGLAYLLKTMKLAGSDQQLYSDIHQLLMNGLRESPTEAYFEEPYTEGMEWCFHSNVRTTALILQTLLETEEEFQQAPKVVKWLIKKRSTNGAWYNTQENIYVLHALNTYFRRYEATSPDLKLVVKLEGRKISESIYKGHSLRQDFRVQGLSDIKRGKDLKLKFDKSGEGRYYYEARLTYYPRDLVDAVDRGISIAKKWEIIEGEKGDDAVIEAGSTIKVTLTIATPMERTYVAVDDPLPAGFEVINTQLKTVSNVYREHKTLELSSNYWGGFNFFEIRDDRVLIFADNLPKGVHTFVYLCKALTSGKYMMPATKVEEMYTPEVFGRTGERMLTIE
ncbi:Ig-like domain-containing protein [candidate division KSB1 bacterium]|nr:Ig-like domain-containing protein [candidate division KSB1 bacterium]